MKYVALLRGINVGGNNLVPMKELCALFAASGCTNVSSYIQSGNVLFDAQAKASAGLAPRIEAAIAKRFAVATPVQLRTAAELAAVIDNLPFDDAARVYVGFLAAAPSKAQVTALDKLAIGAPDRYVVRGREVYLDLGNAARTKLTVGLFDKHLTTVTTMRNWNTVTKLRDLLGAQNA
jgi:uncharacterized protein (DUF1697 family)